MPKNLRQSKTIWPPCPSNGESLEAVRRTIRRNLPRGIKEGIQYGMIGYFVPHSIYPAGYHCDPTQPLPLAALALQKNHMALYLMCAYGDAAYAEWFRNEWKKTGKRLDMGKSCIRFKQLDDLPLELIGRRCPSAASTTTSLTARRPGQRTPREILESQVMGPIHGALRLVFATLTAANGAGSAGCNPCRFGA